jgi:hypothetical protein
LVVKHSVHLNQAVLTAPPATLCGLFGQALVGAGRLNIAAGATGVLAALAM